MERNSILFVIALIAAIAMAGSAQANPVGGQINSTVVDNTHVVTIYIDGYPGMIQNTSTIDGAPNVDNYQFADISALLANAGLAGKAYNATIEMRCGYGNNVHRNTTPTTAHVSCIDDGMTHFASIMEIEPCPAETNPDLIVASITPNCGYLFGNESNTISAKIENIGNGTAVASTACFVLSDGHSATASVPQLAPGANDTVTITDPTIRAAGVAVTITVTADCDDANPTEWNESNNVTPLDVTVVNNGYKGKRWTGGEDINTVLKTEQGNIDLKYAVCNATYYVNVTGTHNFGSGETYLSGGRNWSVYAAEWDTTMLPIPGGATTIENATLYVYYTWDKYDPLEFNVSFNGNNHTMADATHYWDRKLYDGWDQPTGMLAYDVAGDFIHGATNDAIVYDIKKPSSDQVTMHGMVLAVIYENETEPERLIYVNEGFDLLNGKSSKCTTPDEATAYANFTGVPNPDIFVNATLVTITTGASKPAKNNLFFNSDKFEGGLAIGTYPTDEGWCPSYGSSYQEITPNETGVLGSLQLGDNEARFQDSGDYLCMANAFLKLEKSGKSKIWIDQPEYVQPQDQFYVNITVDPLGNPISAVQYDLYYNTSVIWAEWANPGPFLNQSGAETDVVFKEIYNEWDVANHIGRITYSETTLANPPGSGLPYVTEPGVLTAICFSAIGEPDTSSDLIFEDVKMSGPAKNPIPPESVDCSVKIYENKDPVANASSKYWVSNVASKFQCFAALCCCNSHGGNDTWKGDNITYIRWDFGDGQYGTSEGLEDCQKPHMYTSWNWIGEDGTGYYLPFIAQLTVRDDGCPPKSNTTAVQVTVYIAGDTNGDGIVDIFDAACVGKHWMQKADNNPPKNCTRYWTKEQPDEADLNNDNTVDIIDAMIVGTNWDHIAWYPYELE